ncbi:phosphoenolpyruvate--protein phosphotransferase [Rhizobium bangladeshense]|uniref:Phosphoenolpyruvate--protein phosphotransferase n=1 Tax=Rhizobium bangladeshense TaxID=1138189 RepID=A0ABS7LCH2_9HYPH|nr:putative PEP-binding protein [Rhizobium bangladeshense]MBX4870878.1 phosphoenolpyruvate--protein phosphotransferase [Rhizobium bangladeshense]MBX4876361.1 phosphoenolpyruvate--protein phosphotransferase [Rhizobium bangladeshense]MBX4887325.1 phosphoenolpyruvate--protein phosphotransferase [Rhizobium bangladeshense]MBX4900764.1 phosphoenolpyruvate--protein phosphotransferase [Rhizobium bangladeshense]MBY3589139.1 phosphoenolpyruvate--protein phosphotransferase [Rhizobium bangladeshense]
MAEPLRLKAKSASPGIASGPAFLAEEPKAVSTPGTAGGYGALEKAIHISIRELERLAEGADAESRDIIDFQIEVLRDPTIAEATGARMQAEENVVFAWIATLDAYIGELEAADEEPMRARAVDILDIKNRVLGALAGTPVADFPPGSVFVGKDMEPSRFLAHDWSKGGGIALFAGSAAGHVALLARAKSVPMVVGTGRFSAADGDPVGVDGDAGAVILKAGGMLIPPLAPAGDTKLESGELRTTDGVPILISININDPAEIDALDPATAGVGLMRSEFSVTSIADAANEERQLAIYRRVLEQAGQNPVTIRMLDIGGDKPLAGLEDPPALEPGLRGVRLLLARPEIARVQARALLRAAVFGKLSVMLPMVSFPEEVDRMRELFREEAEKLGRRALQHRMPPIGMMVEVPSAALMLDTFASAAFFSFGTNDLTQYLAASHRDGNEVDAGKVAPAVLRLIEQAVKLAGGKPLSICGDMAGDPRYLPELLAAGLRHFSVAPAHRPAIRSAIIGLNADGTRAAGE